MCSNTSSASTGSSRIGWLMGVLGSTGAGRRTSTSAM
jgi:hypothetical protein